jgi:LysM domain
MKKHAAIIFCLVFLSAIVFAQQSTIVVAPGDSLWKIAQRTGRSAYCWAGLFWSNPSIANQNMIFPGQRITVPSRCLKFPRPREGAQFVHRTTQSATFEDIAQNIYGDRSLGRVLRRINIHLNPNGRVRAGQLIYLDLPPDIRAQLPDFPSLPSAGQPEIVREEPPDETVVAAPIPAPTPPIAPEPEPEPEPPVAIEPPPVAPAPIVAARAEIAPTPQPITESPAPPVIPEPESALEPEPIPEPIPEPTPEPPAAPEPPEPTPVPSVIPEPAPEPEPEPTPTPPEEPEAPIVTEPPPLTTAPIVTARTDIAPVPEPIVELPEPVPAPEPAPAPPVVPEPEPEPEPTPEPVTVGRVEQPVAQPPALSPPVEVAPEPMPAPEPVPAPEPEEKIEPPETSETAPVPTAEAPEQETAPEPEPEEPVGEQETAMLPPEETETPPEAIEEVEYRTEPTITTRVLFTKRDIRRVGIWTTGITALGSFSLAYYYKKDADGHYDEYINATDPVKARELHDKTDESDSNSYTYQWMGSGLATVCIGLYIWQIFDDGDFTIVDRPVQYPSNVIVSFDDKAIYGRITFELP